MFLHSKKDLSATSWALKMFADFRQKLFWNAYLPIFDIWSRFISVSHSHALNAKLPSESTEAGKFTEVNLQPEKAFSPIYVNES